MLRPLSMLARGTKDVRRQGHPHIARRVKSSSTPHARFESSFFLELCDIV